MSIISIFTREAPTIAGRQFDAVLQDTFEANVELTEYVIELGARATDHRVILPFKWSIVGAVSNNPLRTNLTDFTGALPFDSGVLSTIAGLSAGFLAGSSETRSSATLEFLIGLMTTGEPFDIDAGDIQLTNMVIARIRRTKDPENENGLIFEADLQEYPTLATTLSKNQPPLLQLDKNDPACTQAVAPNNRGEVLGIPSLQSTVDTVKGFFG